MIIHLLPVILSALLYDPNISLIGVVTVHYVTLILALDNPVIRKGFVSYLLIFHMVFF